MSRNLNYGMAWLGLLGLVFVVLVMVAVPVWLIQPFAAQTGKDIELSFLLRNWSPLVSVIATLLVIPLAVFIWINSRRWFGKVALFIPLFIVLLLTWFARQNHFEWMFNPLGQATFPSAGQTDFVADDDMVLAVTINGDAAAYPIRQMAYHHVVQDVVGGTPITATY